MLKFIVEPLRLRLDHLLAQELDKLLLSNLGEQFLIKDSLVYEFSPWQSA